MSIQVTIDGLDYDVDVTMIDSPSDIDPETYMALRGLKGDKGDKGDPAPPSVTSYNELLDKPEIEGIVLEGNKTFSQLDLNVLSNTGIQEIFDDLI